MGQQQHQRAVGFLRPPDVDGTVGDARAPFLFGLLVGHDHHAAAHALGQGQQPGEDSVFVRVAAPSQQQHVRPQAAQSVRLQQGLDGRMDVFVHDDGGKRLEFLLADELAQEDFGLAPPLPQLVEIAADDLADGDDAAVGGQPGGVFGQMQPVVGPAAQGQDGRPPVLGVIAFALQLQEGVAGALVGETAAHVAPPHEDFGAGDQEIQERGQPDGRRGPGGVDQEHDAHAAQRAQQCQRPVVGAERGPEAGIVGDAFIEASQIDGAVGQQEEHRDDGRDGVEIAGQHAGLRDEEGQDDGPPRLRGPAAAAGEERQAAEHAVAREGLQDARRAHQAAERGRQRGADHARVDQRAGNRAVLHHEPGAQQLRPRHAGRQQEGDGRVERGGNADGRERAARDGTAGLPQVARHVDAGHDARDGREEEREDGEQGVAGDPRRREIRAEDLRRIRQSRAREKRRHGQQQHGQNSVLQADRPPRADVDAEKNGQVRRRRRRAEGQIEVGKRGHERFGEAEHVERDGRGLRDVEKNGDDAAEFRPQAAADEIVGAAALDPHVRCDGRDRESRDQRDGRRAGEDQQRVPQPRVTHHGIEPQEHDHAEDRQQARREHAAERAEAGGGLGFRAHSGSSIPDRAVPVQPVPSRRRGFWLVPDGANGVQPPADFRLGRRSWDGSSVGRARAF